ncbi:hypothetical protein Tco_0374271 [Tanacetum coccineum]
MGMDWLSKRKFVIVCHEKVVRIPLEGDEILQVHGERTQGVVKTLMNTKVDEPKLSDISVVRDLLMCFRKICRRPPQRQVDFRIDLVHGATSVAKSPYRLAPLEMQILGVSDTTLRHGVHLKLVLELLRNEKLYAKFTKNEAVQNLGSTYDTIRDMIILRIGRVKLRRVRAMSMTIQSSVKDKIFATSSETSKVENAPAEMLRDLDQQIEKRADDDNSKEWNSGDDQLRLRWMIYLVVLADAAESVRDTIGFDYHSSIWCAPFEALYGMKCWSPVLWAEIGESSLTGLELVLDTTDKVVLIKEKLKAARYRQKSYADNRRKPLEFEVGDRVMLKVSPWKGVIRFRKKGKLAPRYVGPFEILERVGPVAYRLRLPEELSGVHDTFHVSNLKKCLADASLHVPLDEIKVDKTLCFVEEPVENSDCEVMRLKCSRMVIVKVRFWLEARSLRLQAKWLAVRYLVKVSWNSKCNFELTWVWEDYLKDKLDNQSNERDRLNGIGFVLDFVEFISFTFGDKEMILVIEALAVVMCIGSWARSVPLCCDMICLVLWIPICKTRCDGGELNGAMERIFKKRTKNEAKTTKPDTEWKSVEKTQSSPSPSVEKSTQVNPDKPEAKSQEKQV